MTCFPIEVNLHRAKKIGHSNEVLCPISGGRCEIRTHGPFRAFSFQD